MMTIAMYQGIVYQEWVKGIYSTTASRNSVGSNKEAVLFPIKLQTFTVVIGKHG
jgi:hypothetical protein